MGGSLCFWPGRKIRASRGLVLIVDFCENRRTWELKTGFASPELWTGRSETGFALSPLKLQPGSDPGSKGKTRFQILRAPGSTLA